MRISDWSSDVCSSDLLARTFYLAGPQVMTAMVAEQLANAAASGEVDLGEIGRETAASLFNNLVRGEPQLQCLTHPDAAPSSAQIDQWANAAVVTFKIGRASCRARVCQYV